MRPLGYGLIVFFGSGIMWFLFSIAFGIEYAYSGTETYGLAVEIFGWSFFFSLPAAIAAEVIQFFRRRKR